MRPPSSPSDGGESRAPHFVQSLERGLAVIRAFDERWFTLSPRILELGYAYLSSLSLTEVAEPHLERLVAEVHESSSVLEEGLRSIAAPISDRNGRTIAAVNLSAHASRMSLDEGRRRLVPALLATAARIEADLRAAQSARPQRFSGSSG